MRFELQLGTDDYGDPEEFSWDLFPVVDSRRTLHLDQDGLPKLGTKIVPGMIIIGKIGKAKDYDPEHQPSALEIHGLEPEDLRRKYGHMWRDSSLYADEDAIGIVNRAFLEKTSNGAIKAIVELTVE